MALKARPLPPGGTIGVPAPASPYHNRSEILRGVEWWEDRGYKVKLGAGIFDRDAYVAGDAKTRATDIMEMFTDDDVDVVQTMTGGYGSAQTIPFLDFEAIAANPKPFVGYSDITALHAALRHHADLVTFYGPGLMEVNHKDTKEFTQKHMLRALTSTGALGEVPRNPDDDYVRAFVGGVARGQMVGGCLWLLGQTIGTPWQIDLHDKVFFFEDVDAPPWYIDGLLNQMKQAGMLESLRAVVVGELTRCDWQDGKPTDFPQMLSVEDVLERYIEPLGVPTIYGLPLGHGKHLYTAPLGVEVTVDADNKKLVIEESALSKEGRT